MRVRLPAVVLGLLLTGAPASAEAPRLDIDEMSLEDLLDTPVSVASASGVSTSTFEAPAIVTVITRQEIHDLGARDLVDVLRFVPGFDFTADVEGTIGLAVRGVSALEGKALVMVDGMPLNDLAYGNVLFGNREAIELIERIEVMRGPGSTVYGGFAELAVINVVTHPDAPVDRVAGAITGGALPTSLGRVTGSLLGSHSFGALHLRGWVFGGTTVESDATANVGGVTVPMADRSRIRPFSLSLAADWRDLAAQLSYEDYRHDSAVPEDPSRPLTERHGNLFAALRWSHDFSHQVSVAAFARWQHQNPWEAKDAFALATGYYFDKAIDRLLGGASVIWKPVSWLRLFGGATYTHDMSTVPRSDDPEVQAANSYTDAAGNPTRTLSFDTVAGFAEAVATTPWVNITAGARYEHHSRSGGAFVPRVALTRDFGRFHAKALFGQAFRTPTFENFSLSTQLRPERSTVTEFEAGYQFTSWLYAGLDVFGNRVQDTIIYQRTAGEEQYLNAGTVGSRGVEVEVRLKGRRGYANVSYGFYAAPSIFEDDTMTQFSVPGQPRLHLGLPAHKVTARGSWHITPWLDFSPAVMAFSERWAMVAPTGSTESALTRFPPGVVLDAFFTLHDVQVPGLELSFGVHDLLGTQYRYLPAYDGGINSLPGPGREVMVRLAYLRDFGG